MRFRTQIYEASCPYVARSVIVSYEGMSHAASPDVEGTPTTGLQLIVSVKSDHNEDGTPDTSVSIPQQDFQKRFNALPSQYATIDAILRGTGNFMAVVRNYLKTQVTAHNTWINPGGPAATFVDLDSD